MGAKDSGHEWLISACERGGLDGGEEGNRTLVGIAPPTDFESILHYINQCVIACVIRLLHLVVSDFKSAPV